ncbi:hypothetical protein GCM10025875_04490 [Litorihabitans aurantiacus]|uniref:Uncharacterized protein n=1 Tax=Litorihabitans aurantiacus TaxID=1930061 RepID=A0AA37UWK7_9MICO|nr:hypothetical protein GCM10025875_04490 [Litorihabitans aurantiacus]
MLVVADDGAARLHPEAPQELAQGAGVLGGDDVGLGQEVAQVLGGVARAADGGRGEHDAAEPAPAGGVGVRGCSGVEFGVGRRVGGDAGVDGVGRVVSVAGRHLVVRPLVGGVRRGPGSVLHHPAILADGHRCPSRARRGSAT